MNKFLEVKLNEQIDRYKLIGVTVDDFIDTFIVPQKRIDNLSNLKEITESEYEMDKRFELDMNVEDRFQVQHYVFKHPSKEDRNRWNGMIRQINRSL